MEVPKKGRSDVSRKLGAVEGGDNPEASVKAGAKAEASVKAGTAAAATPAKQPSLPKPSAPKASASTKR